MMIILRNMLEFEQEYMQLELEYDEHLWADGNAENARAVWYGKEY